MAADSAELWITRSTEGGGEKTLLFPSSLLLCLLNLVQKKLTSKAGAEIHNLRGAEYFIVNPEMSETTLNPKECLAPWRAGGGRHSAGLALREAKLLVENFRAACCTRWGKSHTTTRLKWDGSAAFPSSSTVNDTHTHTPTNTTTVW